MGELKDRQEELAMLSLYPGEIEIREYEHADFDYYAYFHENLIKNSAIPIVDLFGIQEGEGMVVQLSDRSDHYDRENGTKSFSVVVVRTAYVD